MDDASGTFFAAVLTVIGVVLLFTAAIMLLPFLLIGAALYLGACFVWALTHPEAEGGELESQPRERP